MEKKISVGIGSLCKGLPEEFSDFLMYARKLEFEDLPDYEMCKNNFKV